MVGPHSTGSVPTPREFLRGETGTIARIAEKDEGFGLPRPGLLHARKCSPRISSKKKFRTSDPIAGCGTSDQEQPATNGWSSVARTKRRPDGAHMKKD